MTRYLTTVCAWSGRLLALSLMIVAVGEAVQMGLCELGERRRG